MTIWCCHFSCWTFADITKSMQADENMRSELEEDVKEECIKLGPVDSVKVIDLACMPVKINITEILF